MCRWCWSATSIVAASSPALSARTPCCRRASGRACAGLSSTSSGAMSALFADGVREIERRTGWPCLGVVPWFDGGAAPAGRGRPGPCRKRRSRDPAQGHDRGACAEPDRKFRRSRSRFAPNRPCRVRIVQPGEPIPVADVVLTPGYQSDDRRSRISAGAGLGHRHRRAPPARRPRGGNLRWLPVARPLHCRPGRHRGAGRYGVQASGLLDVETVLAADKTTRAVTGRHTASGAPIAGYEIHLGRTSGPDCARPVFEIGGRA